MFRTGSVSIAIVIAASLAAPPAVAQRIEVEGARVASFGPWGLLLSVNQDDDDENRRRDDRQSPPAGEDDDVRVIDVSPPPEAATVAVEAVGSDRFRVHAAGLWLTLPASLPVADAGRLTLDGIRASASAADARLVLRFLDASGDEAGTSELAITVVGISFLDATNSIRDGTRESLQFSNEITNDDSLPRGNEYGATSDDPDNFRIEAWAPGIDGAGVRLESRASGAASVRASLGPLAMAGPGGAAPRSGFVRLVADAMDWTAAGVVRQVLRADLRDVVSAIVVAPDGQQAATDLRVGRPGNEDGPEAARRAAWSIHLLRIEPGGAIALGVDEETAKRIARDQVTASNEMYASCNITFGPPGETTIAIEDPPGPTLIAVADADGLTSAGGEVRLSVNGTAIGPVVIGRDWLPHQTASAIAGAITSAGFDAEVSENARVDWGAGRSADVLVRDGDGRFVRIEALDGVPLTTDRRQTISIGALQLGDRLTEFNNATSSAGMLEERVMIKGLEDGDPTTIDLFVVNGFAGGGRQGEAFIERDGGMIRNALVLDRTGIRQSRQAWTQSHEAGHVLLDEGYHPDNFGEDTPSLLMDSDNSLGAVNGPKRLREIDCAQIRRESGEGASPPLLRRWDEVSSDRLVEPEDVPMDPGYPRR